MTAIETEAFSTASDYVGTLRRSHERWIGRKRSETGWMFRGQGKASYPLLPSAFRRRSDDSLLALYANSSRRYYDKRDWASWAKHPLAPGSDAATRMPEVAFEALMHAAIVRKFGLLADNVRHPVTMPPLLWHLYSSAADAFSKYFYGDLTAADAELFAVAQHHGVPTPFLDWTYNPLAAAYFAVEQALKCDGNEDVAVWALRGELFDYEWQLVRHTVRAGVTPFLDAQEGLFTWCPKAYILKLQRGAYVPFEQLIAGCDADPRFAGVARPFVVKLILCRSEIPELLNLLWRERMTPAHLMPTFDHVTRALTLEMKWLRPAAGVGAA